MDSLRQFIRQVLLEIESNSPVKDAFDDFEKALGDDAKNIDNISKLSQQDIKNQETKIKSDTQTKNKLNADNPDKKGFEVSIPLKQKELDLKKKNAEDLQKAKGGLMDAQKKIEDQKKKLDLEKKAAELKQKQNVNTQQPNRPVINSVLPSLDSPI